MKIDVKERIACRFLRISEGHVSKVNGSVLYFHDRLSGIADRRFFIKDLNDTLCGFNRHREHNVDHGDHHERHEDHEAVCHESRDLSDVDLNTMTRNSHLGSDVKEENDVKVQAELHERRVKSYDLFCSCKVLPDVIGCLAEFILLVIFPGKAFDHAHSADVFFDRLIELIVLFEYGTESRHCKTSDDDKSYCKDRDDNNERRSQRSSENISHNDRENEHHRSPYGDPYHHHVSILNSRDISRHSGDER